MNVIHLSAWDAASDAYITTDAAKKPPLLRNGLKHQSPLYNFVGKTGCARAAHTLRVCAVSRYEGTAQTRKADGKPYGFPSIFYALPELPNMSR
jgi:hypothetical protein